MSRKVLQRQVCRRCGAPHKSDTGLCIDCRPVTVAKRPEGPCTGCRRTTTSPTGMCKLCQELDALATIPAHDDTLDHTDGYTGQWARRGLVLVPTGVTIADRYGDVITEAWQDTA